MFLRKTDFTLTINFGNVSRSSEFMEGSKVEIKILASKGPIIYERNWFIFRP